MESSLEPPECPVCLSSYDGEYTIPRVLSCGHTACESCLKNLPQKYPLTIRCPACTQLVKFPSPTGPSSLPKNIDLLRLVAPTQHEKPTTTCGQSSQNDPQVPDFDFQFVPPLWSDEFYGTWRNWILPKDDVLVEEIEEGDGFGVLKEGKRKVRLFKVGGCGLLNIDNVTGSGFKLSYTARVMSFLYQMTEEERAELGLVLKVALKQEKRICKFYGFWGDLKNGNLYLVCQMLNGNVGYKLGDIDSGLNEYGLSGFAMVGMEMCEAVIALHLEGLIMGCAGLSCFELDKFGHANLSLSEMLVTGRAVLEGITKACYSAGRIGDKELRTLIGEFLRNEVFVSPEVLFEALKKEGIAVECGSFGYSVGDTSDVWSLACILIRLFAGKQLIEELIDHLDNVILETSEENSSNFFGIYMCVIEKVSSLLKSKFGEEFESLRRILCGCLNFDPGKRPPVIDLWKCIRELIIRIKFDAVLVVGGTTCEYNKGHCLVLGELCWVHTKRSDAKKNDALQGAENNDVENLDQEEVRDDKNFIGGFVEGKFKFREMHGHLDCVTGLAIGGGFLFSSSFDKSVHVWSLQDLSHVHMFKGHEHKVMAVTYVDEEQPLCISGDSGGGIFLWSIMSPLGQEPLKKWYEQKDWRYSGIHALTTAGNGYLYTGSGDRSIKAWSLQDGTLSCTMDGHKSVVSTLAATNGVLCSGSWDGTIRLWSLSDHSLLTVLGEDMPGTVNPILSLTANLNTLVATHENGHIKLWKNDVLMKSTQCHKGAVFAVSMEGKILSTGGWDKTINIQEISEDEFQIDIRPIGSILGGAVVTALLYWQGKLYVGYGDRTIKVYYYGKDL